MSWPWSELGLSGPAGLPEIRRAYAQRLKNTHPEEDPEGFQRLHAAYQEASRQARRVAAQAAPEAAKPAPEFSRYIAREDDLQKPQEEEPETEDWDYEELLKGREAPQNPHEKKERPKEADWDYDELLKDQEPSRKSPEQPEQAEKAGWDYGKLLEEEPEKPEKQPEERPKSADWDYERLFAEGEAEAQEARRRKLEELRRKNRARYTAQEQEQRKRAADEEEAWTAVMAAAHALELLYSSGAPLSQWRRFLNDPVFWNVRANLDFVFALEDFIERHPDLSKDIRKAIFAAYGFEKGPGNPVYRRLFRLLDVDRKEKRRMAKAQSRWRAAWRSYPAWRKAGIVICFSILAVVFLLGWAVNLQTAYHDFMERKAGDQWENQVPAWLEEDYGEPFVLAVRDNIYAPESDPTLYFWVTQDGERTEDWPGYRTDYPHVRVMRAMEDFAEDWDLDLKLDSSGGGFTGGIGDAPGAYLFGLPLLGAEGAITALGELVRELEAQDWYRVPEDKYGGKIEYQIFLCHEDLSFYDAVSTQDGGFETEEALDRYQSAGPAFCRYILEHGGLAAKHMGEDAFLLLDLEPVEVDGKQFFHVAGLDKATYTLKVHYLMATGGGMIFCVPDGGLEQIDSIMDLYLGSSSHLQVDGVGLVMIWDQV